MSQRVWRGCGKVSGEGGKATFKIRRLSASDREANPPAKTARAGWGNLAAQEFGCCVLKDDASLSRTQVPKLRKSTSDDASVQNAQTSTVAKSEAATICKSDLSAPASLRISTDVDIDQSYL